MTAARDLTTNTLTVGIAAAALADETTASIVTHALGSCVAVVVWDRTLRIGGLLHYLLPTARGARPGERSDEAFADTGIPKLFEAMYGRGCRKENIDVVVVGGASMGPKPVSDVFDIGARNVVALRKILFRNAVLIKAEEVGGSISRTVTLHVPTGRVVVRSPNGERDLVAATPAPAREPLVAAVGPRAHQVPSGGLVVIDNPSATLVTGALGSSVAAVAWDPVVRVGGVLVFQLPTARGARPGERPETAFADAGLPLLFEAMYRKGCRKEGIELCVVGGACMTAQGGSDVFDVGSRNVTALRRILFKNSVLIRAEDVGGQASRTVTLDVGNGRVVVRSLAGERCL